MHKMRPRIAYVTGTDANRMLNTGLLCESFRTHMPDQTLHVCDFGMSTPEQGFWADAGFYRARPDSLPAGVHPWRYKASICQFIDRNAYDAVVWLDADMILLAPIHDDISAMVMNMKAEGGSVAVASDASDLSVRDAIRTFSAAGNDLGAFDALITAHAKDDAAAYLNTGFFVMCDFALADLWARETMGQSDWLLFEQNTFNALVGSTRCPVHLLDPGIWNIHGELLADVDIVDPDLRVKVLHTTSSEQRHHIENEIQYPVGDLVLPGWFKLFVREDLRDLQQEYLLGFLKRHLDLLIRHGLLVTPD